MLLFKKLSVLSWRRHAAPPCGLPGERFDHCPAFIWLPLIIALRFLINYFMPLFNFVEGKKYDETIGELFKLSG
jgi:hypothetical protein